MIKKILMSEDLFKLLKDHVEIPETVKGMTIKLEILEPVIIECAYYPNKLDPVSTRPAIPIKEQEPQRRSPGSQHKYAGSFGE